MNMNCPWTDEELAARASGDLPAEAAQSLDDHLRRCDSCCRRLEAIRCVDAALSVLPRHLPSMTSMLQVRRSLAAQTRGRSEPEILTLEELAEFLRVSLEELGEVVDTLPAFELGGQVRVRRAMLLEWLEHRERLYRNANIQSQASRASAGRLEEEGVL